MNSETLNPPAEADWTAAMMGRVEGRANEATL